MTISPVLYQFLVCCFASVGSFTYGYDLGIIAQVIASESFTEYMNYPNTTVTGLIVSLFTVGAFAGALLAGFLEKLSRRQTILLATIFFLLVVRFNVEHRILGSCLPGDFLLELVLGYTL